VDIQTDIIILIFIFIIYFAKVRQ